MNNHPLNLALRFLLEISLVTIYALWGWTNHTGPYKYFWAWGLTIAVSIAWAVFRVDGDPGNAIVSIPGWLRLLFEAVVFCFAIYFLYQLKYNLIGLIFTVVVLIHYCISYDRIYRLLGN